MLAIILLIMIVISLSLWMASAENGPVGPKRDNKGMMRCPRCNWKSNHRSCDHCGMTISQ